MAVRVVYIPPASLARRRGSDILRKEVEELKY
jgi:hypothetical protein